MAQTWMKVYVHSHWIKGLLVLIIIASMVAKFHGKMSTKMFVKVKGGGVDWDYIGALTTSYSGA